MTGIKMESIWSSNTHTFKSWSRDQASDSDQQKFTKEVWLLVLNLDNTKRKRHKEACIPYWVCIVPSFHYNRDHEYYRGCVFTLSTADHEYYRARVFPWVSPPAQNNSSVNWAALSMHNCLWQRVCDWPLSEEWCCLQILSITVACYSQNAVTHKACMVGVILWWMG